MSGELADVIKIFPRCLFLSPTAYPKLPHPMTGQIGFEYRFKSLSKKYVSKLFSIFENLEGKMVKNTKNYSCTLVWTISRDQQILCVIAYMRKTNKFFIGTLWFLPYCHIGGCPIVNFNCTRNLPNWSLVELGYAI